MALEFMKQEVSHFVSGGTTCIEVRYLDQESRPRILPVNAHYFEFTRVVFVFKELQNVDLTQPFRLLGGVKTNNEQVYTRFPTSLAFNDPHFTYGNHSITAPFSVTSYYVACNQGKVDALLWAIPIDFFYLMTAGSGVRPEVWEQI